MTIANSIVGAVLRSPLHRVLSGSTDLVRYTGRLSGREITTPTQYARRGDDVVILVGRPRRKVWWRNFREDRPIELLLRRRWEPMTARAVLGADEPDVAAPLLESYLERFPRAARALGGGTDEERIRAAVLVWCRPADGRASPGAVRDPK
jgi:F420H(2)-dependent quinone reductase